MCIAIFKPANKTISKAALQQCFLSNPNGAGFMYAKGKELHIHKGFFTFKDFYNAYLPYENEVCAIHFRIKTHGAIDETNCHPFRINKGLGFIHNGIIGGFGFDDKSDTFHFNEAIMKPLVNKYGNNILVNPAIKSLIESKIGYSKFVMLDRHGNWTLFNESKGIWDDGVWYSNSSYKPYVAPPMTYGQHTPYKTPFLPTKVNANPSNIKIGDLVKLTRNAYDFGTKKLFKTGELLEVVAVNSDFTVDLMGEDEVGTTEFCYNVPYNKFDILLNEDIPSNDSENAFELTSYKGCLL